LSTLLSLASAGRKATLESYGIETAADLYRRAILVVPGFGGAMAQKLLDWRRQVEQDFVFDPRQPIDPQQIAALDHELASEKREIEQELVTGASELSQLKRQAELQFTSLKNDLEAAGKALVQARADKKAQELHWR
jgi:DNA-binding helix-hairpin-helix protein with protein kinase domain